MPPRSPSADALPYRDTKPQGAADFYFAINATFRFMLAKFGHEGWRRYLEELARDYFAPVNRRWQQGGFTAIAQYWRAFFQAEPGARVEVNESPERVQVAVLQCPAIAHLRSSGRPIVKEYCQHCYFLGEARARAAGFTMRVEGGNGACVHTYCRADASLPAQDLRKIEEVR